MIYHVVAIREAFGQKFSIDVLVFGTTEENLRDFLRENKLVALELYEYKKEKVKSFGKIKILLNYNGEDIIFLSNTENIEDCAYGFLVLGFDIKNINYVDENKLSPVQVEQIIEKTKKEATDWMTYQQKLEKAKQAKDDEQFNDEKLQKTLLIASKLVTKIPKLIKDAGDLLPKQELKELYTQGQELSKLKMGRNLEKLSGYLEKTYNNYNKIEQEYLAAQKASRIKVSGSNVSNIFVASEIQKLEKARGMKEVSGGSMDIKSEDTFYATFGNIGIYLKLLYKDIIGKIKELPKNFHKIFGYSDKFLTLLIMFTCLYLVINGTKGNINSFSYVILIISGIFGFVLYFTRLIKKEKITFNFLLLGGRLLVSLLLVFFFKENFLF